MILLLSGYCIDEFARLEGNVEGRQELRFRIKMRKCKAPKFEPTQPEMKAA